MEIKIIEELNENNLDTLLIPTETKATIADIIYDQEGKKTIYVEEKATLTYLLVCEHSNVDLEIVHQ